MSAPKARWTAMERSGVKRWRLPYDVADEHDALFAHLDQTPPGSPPLPADPDASPGKMLATLPTPCSMPDPRLNTWKPPESVMIGLGQFMNRCRPPCAATISAPGRR